MKHRRRNTRGRRRRSRRRSRRSHIGGKRTSNIAKPNPDDGAMKRRVTNFENQARLDRIRKAQLDNLSNVSKKAVARWRITQPPITRPC